MVLPLESAPELVTSCGAATKAVRKALPPGTVVFETPKSNLHCTVFKLSSPTDPVTDPLVRRMEGEGEALLLVYFTALPKPPASPLMRGGTTPISAVPPLGRRTGTSAEQDTWGTV